METTPLNPIFNDVPLVNPDLTPSEYFIRWAQMILNRVGGYNSVSLSSIANTTVIQEQISADYTGVGDAAVAFEALAGPSGTNQASGYYNATFSRSGTYLFSDLTDLSPDVNLDMDGRGQVIIIPGNNLPATTSNYSGQTYGAGAPAALFRSARIAPDPGANHSRATYQLWRGFNVDFTGTVQANTVSAFRTPNPNPANNSFDADPAYTTNKVYTAGTLEYVEIWAPSGDGWTIESGNGRAYVHSSRVLNAGGNGYTFGANDVVMAGHWAAGGCLGFGIKAGQDAGFWATSGNIWGNSAYRSVSCGAMWLFNRKLFGVQNCEFNDWLRMDGGDGTAGNQGFYRGGVMSGNVFAPFASNFVSDGVAIDTTASGPDSRLQANVGITGYQSGAFYGNVHTRTDKTSFTTPYNTGGWGGPGTLGYVAGDTTGTYGTAPAYLYDVGANAIVVIDDAISTAPNVKPWCNTNPATASYSDPVPINQHSSGQALYRFRDGYTGVDRSGARGVQYHFMFGVSETAFPSTTYYGELGDASQSLRYVLNGNWELQKAQQYTSAAFNDQTYTTSFSRTIQAAQVVQKIACTGTIAAGTITLPTGLNASQYLDIILTGTVTALTWAVTGGGSINSSAANLPAYSTGYLSVRLWYELDNNTWDCLGVIATTQGGFLGRIDNTAAPAGVVGEQMFAKVNSGSAVSLTNATVGNVTSITLTPGDWNVTGVVQLTGGGTTCVPTLSKAGISTVSASNITTTDASAYCSRGCAVANVAGEDFENLSMGPNRITVAAGTTQQVWLNARCNFTGTGTPTVTAYGQIRAIRTA